MSWGRRPQPQVVASPEPYWDLCLGDERTRGKLERRVVVAKRRKASIAPSPRFIPQGIDPQRTLPEPVQVS